MSFEVPSELEPGMFVIFHESMCVDISPQLPLAVVASSTSSCSVEQVLTALDPEERKLFADRIRALDRRIMPGVSKLSWQTDKHALEFFFKEARKHCRIADSCVTEFKAGLARIDSLCKGIAEGLLIDVEKKKLYEYTEFEAVQAKHHSLVSPGVWASRNWHAYFDVTVYWLLCTLLQPATHQT